MQAKAMNASWWDGRHALQAAAGLAAIKVHNSGEGARVLRARMDTSLLNRTPLSHPQTRCGSGVRRNIANKPPDVLLPLKEPSIRAVDGRPSAGRAQLLVPTLRQCAGPGCWDRLPGWPRPLMPARWTPAHRAGGRHASGMCSRGGGGGKRRWGLRPTTAGRGCWGAAEPGPACNYAQQSKAQGQDSMRLRTTGQAAWPR